MPSTVRTPTAPPNEPSPKPQSPWPLYLALLALLFSVGSSGWLLIQTRSQQTELVQLRAELTAQRQELLTLRQAYLTEVADRTKELQAIRILIAQIPGLDVVIQKLAEAIQKLAEANQKFVEVKQQQTETQTQIEVVKLQRDEAKRLLAETGELVKKHSLLPSELQALSKRAADLQNSNIGQDKKIEKINKDLEKINKDLEEKKKTIEYIYGSLSDLRNQVNKVPPKK